MQSHWRCYQTKPSKVRTSGVDKKQQQQQKRAKIFQRKLYQDIFHNEYALRGIFFEGLFQVR